MDTESILDRLDGLLREEREAIVRIDTDRLDRCTDEKLGLLAALRAAPSPTPASAGRLSAIRDGLRHNLALLSHGRACLREGIAALAPGGLDPRNGARPGLRLNITG